MTQPKGAGPWRRSAPLLAWLCALLAWSTTRAAEPAEPPAHYDVQARFDPASGYLWATVVVTLPQAEIQPETAFLLNERLEVDRAAFGPGVHVDVTPTDRPIAGLQLITLRFERPPAAPQRLRFKYQGLLNTLDDQPISAQRVELRLENFWFPLRKDLRLTFAVDARIRGLPKGIVAVSQGEFRQQGSRLTVRRTLPDLDLPITGAPGLKKQVAQDVELYASEPDDALVALLHQHALGATAFFRELYGPPQEGPVRAVIVPRAGSGAYARRNYVVIPTYRKPGEPLPTFDQSTPARTVAHEVEHAWMPSPAVGGENYYVSESVAEYMALRYVESAFGADEREKMLERKRKAAAQAGSLLTERRPANAALYQRGPLLLVALEERIGRTALDAILTRRDRPRTHREFIAALTAGAGEQAAKDFETELGETGLPGSGGRTVLPASEPGSTAYSVVMSGSVKGELTVERKGGGVRRAALRFEDRGRGPDLKTDARYDASGVLTSLRVEGVDYGKRAVDERFSTADGRAQWSSRSDSGNAAAGGYYLANQGNAEDSAALARALLQAAGGALDLLPAGRARIEKSVQREVSAGEQRATATLYLIKGLGLQDGTIWLDSNAELFASGGNWLGTVKRGFESALPTLFAAENEVLAAAATQRNRTLRRHPQGPVVIRNARVFDADSRNLRAGMAVVVRGEKIESVVADAGLALPEGAEVIDAGGRVLLPGLWDMHVHVLEQDHGLLDLLAGVTTVRDLGNNPEVVSELAAQFDAGTAPGPTVLKAGLIEGPGQFAAPFGQFVETPAQVRDAVAFYADRGYSQVKLYNSLSPALVKDAVAAAHARGLHVSGHVPAGMTMRETVNAGFDEVNHANFWFLNFMPADVVARTNTPIRFSAVYEHAHELELSSAAVRDFIALLRAQGTVVDPTLVVFENMFTGAKGELAPWMRPWAARLPATVQRGGRSGGRATTPEQRTTYTQSFKRMQQMLAALHAAGVPIVPGTDGTPLQFSRELELYVEAGIPARDVLYLATLGSARVMKKDGESGSIAAGKRADLVLVDGDPTVRIGDVRNTRLVMKGGDIYDAAQLSAAAGLAPVQPSAVSP